MIIRDTVYMQSLNRSRDLMIYLPDDYQTSGKRYPVLYINDGQNAFFDQESYSGCSWGFLEDVYAHHRDVILVAIPCNFEPEMRESEYGAWKTDRTITILEVGRPEPGLGGEGEAYVNFLCYELKPYIDSRYPTDPQDTAITGSSAGGNISFYATLRHPEIFRKCAALSCAFWYYPQQYRELTESSDLSAVWQLYLDLGTNEGNGNAFVNNLYRFDNQMILEALEKKGLGNRLTFRVIEGASHCEAEWRKRVPYFMNLFYGGW